jgi:site-specific recombinase XerD
LGRFSLLSVFAADRNFPVYEGWPGATGGPGSGVAAPLTPDAVRKIVARAGRHAGLEFPIHPHMLRHATGYKLANDGQDTRAIQHYLGHKNIQHTTRYTELATDRFKNFWQD